MALMTKVVVPENLQFIEEDDDFPDASETRAPKAAPPSLGVRAATPLPSFGVRAKPVQVAEQVPVKPAAASAPVAAEDLVTAKENKGIALLKSLSKRFNENASVSYFLKEKDPYPIFTEYKDRMQFSKPQVSDEEILAMFTLAAEKFGSFEIFGDEEYMKRASALAREHGFDVTNAVAPEPEVTDAMRMS